MQESEQRPPSVHKIKSAVTNMHRLLSQKRITFWAPPKLLPEDGERHEMWYELFYDLLMVAGVYNLSHLAVAEYEKPMTFLRLFTLMTYFVVITESWVMFQRYVNRYMAADFVHLFYYVGHIVSSFFMVVYLKGEHHSTPAVPAPSSNCTYNFSNHSCSVKNISGISPGLTSATGGGEAGHGSKDYDLLADQTGFVSGYAASLVLLFCMMARVAYYIPQHRSQAVWTCAGITLNFLVWVCSLPINHSATALAMYWIGLLLEWGCMLFQKLRYPRVIFHVGHMTARCVLLVMIVLGECILQLAISSKPPDEAADDKHKEKNWYKLSLCFALGLICAQAIQYAYGQPHRPEHHVMRRAPLLGGVWVRMHILMALGVISTAIGITKAFETLGVEDYVCVKTVYFLCSGCCVTQFCIVSSRWLHKGFKPGWSRNIAYGYRFLLALAYMVLAFISDQSGVSDTCVCMREQKTAAACQEPNGGFEPTVLRKPYVLLGCVSLIAVFTASIDVFRNQGDTHTHQHTTQVHYPSLSEMSAPQATSSSSELNN